MTKLQIDEENRFEFCFMALGLCISGFKVCCKLAIVIDGMHLKGKYNGILFIATTMNGNDYIFPIAFGVEDIKNDRA